MGVFLYIYLFIYKKIVHYFCSFLSLFSLHCYLVFVSPFLLLPLFWIKWIASDKFPKCRRDTNCTWCFGRSWCRWSGCSGSLYFFDFFHPPCLHFSIFQFYFIFLLYFCIFPLWRILFIYFYFVCVLFLCVFP